MLVTSILSFTHSVFKKASNHGSLKRDCVVLRDEWGQESLKALWDQEKNADCLLHDFAKPISLVTFYQVTNFKAAPN